MDDTSTALRSMSEDNARHVECLTAGRKSTLARARSDPNHDAVHLHLDPYDGPRLSGLCISSEIDICRSSQPAPNIILSARRWKVHPDDANGVSLTRPAGLSARLELLSALQ